MTIGFTKSCVVSAHAIDLTEKIDGYIRDYFQITHPYFVRDYMIQLSSEFLEQFCPESKNLPASLIIQETVEEVFLAIHLSQALLTDLNSMRSIDDFLSTRAGLNCFMILTEEISHFHRYLEHAQSNRCLSKFDLELQAELEKPIITALILKEIFGRSHILEVIHILFNESSYHGNMTNYRLASKTAEKFWKNILQKFGPEIIFSPEFRNYFQQIPLKNGYEKIRLIQSDHKFAA
jgi:hypothetical protein